MVRVWFGRLPRPAPRSGRSRGQPHNRVHPSEVTPVPCRSAALLSGSNGGLWALELRHPLLGQPLSHIRPGNGPNGHSADLPSRAGFAEIAEPKIMKTSAARARKST